MVDLRKIETGQRPTDAAGEMAADIKAAIYRHADRVPLALAIGVLEIVKAEIIREQDDA